MAGQAIEASEASQAYRRQARSTLLVGLSVALIGSLFGVAVVFGTETAVSYPEGWLIASCSVFSAGLLLAMIGRPPEKISTVSSIASLYFTFYLSAGTGLALALQDDFLRVLPYLFWFFPLSAFNKFTNAGPSRKYIDVAIAVAPLAVFAVLHQTILATFSTAAVNVLIVFVMSFIPFALFLNFFSQYQQAYIAEAQRAQALERTGAALRESEERFRRVFDNAGTGIGYLDFDGHIQSSNIAFRRLLGDQDPVDGQPFECFLHAEDRDGWSDHLAAMKNGKRHVFDFEGRLMTSDGRARIVQGNFVYTPASEALPETIIFVCQDMTELRELDKRLRQSQQLEAVGQLTGGIAHDFNNLLTVILGNSERMSEELADRPNVREMAHVTARAAERGAELTKHLLAFARRQPLEPKLVDLNTLMPEMDGLMRRTLTEDIELALATTEDLWLTEIDPGQIEVALLNLAINARDAMPEGGTLTIETANVTLDGSLGESYDDVEPGPYVMISVSDTGTGMPPEVAARAFEPFFTTKDVGKGSGLGLSMVYGFVKQSRGHVKIYSEPGEGTTIKLYFRRAQSGSVVKAADEVEARGGDEHVLVVEDDDMVRAHVVTQLRTLGYRVTDASDGRQALALLAQDVPVDLLFTDVVMPGGINGKELADQAQALRPDLKVLFTSGYTENAIVHRGRLDPGVHLLSKPYRRQELAAKVRRVLDGAPPA